MIYTLFTTQGCHLCEQAQDLFALVNQSNSFTLKLCEIGDAPKLIEQYGIRIPVIQAPAGQELDWPFSPMRLEQFLKDTCSEL
ncbi:Glutaredoxin-like domain (DUF836) [Methylophaga frappieri]|uniref:Glutaredoxin-like domain (DUF836) n=1 Tax=Methylophaga frappieri (strain ATCC BAA-2434 / DSM 25690 / JAM7) TaxID=754477 RepID=I1YGM1_METFJ|nr:glutaredoxin family protein [Methylophaga frappieri]AFJ02064.1 Glutaredoxin-like domain (DUF836) [Methylophaga frappieri]